MDRKKAARRVDIRKKFAKETRTLEEHRAALRVDRPLILYYVRAELTGA